MGLFNQGWGCRCDVCGENADDSIGGRSKWQMSNLAKRRGWICLRVTYWFCSKECLSRWIDDHRDNVAYEGSLMDAAEKLLSS